MKYIAIAILITAFLLGCNQQQIDKLEKKNSKLSARYDSLSEQSELKDDFIEQYTKTINTVYDNLEQVRKRENLLTEFSQNEEKAQNATLRERMMSNFNSIDSYLQESKAKLNQLKESMTETQMHNASLEETIQKLKQSVEEKEQEIAELKENIEQLNVRVASVEGELKEKKEVIDRQTEQLNMVYYIIGSEDELKEKEIIEEKGGIFGIRNTKKLASGFRTEDFISTDITITDTITIQQKIDKVKIMSPHNPNTYKLTGQGKDLTQLEILDPETFWKFKYLVVMTSG